MSISVFIV